MYIDWVIILSVIIIVLTCVFLGYGFHYCVRKINQDVPADKETASQH